MYVWGKMVSAVAVSCQHVAGERKLIRCTSVEPSSEPVSEREREMRKCQRKREREKRNDAENGESKYERERKKACEIVLERGRE